MKKIELTISYNYVPGWSINEALRELWQNANDRQKDGEEFEIINRFNSKKKFLIIGNKDYPRVPYESFPFLVPVKDQKNYILN